MADQNPFHINFQEAISSFSQILFVICAIVILWWILLVVYRLSFHPLSQFPGPRLAAATSWYECYFELIKDGQYVLRLPEMHRKYGPVVRISPRELHISDLEFYHEVYKQNTKYHKDPIFYGGLGITHSSVTITDPHLARQRRELLNPFFSKRTIASLESRILTTIEKFSTRLNGYAASGKPVPLEDAFHCLTADFICEYAFGASLGLLGETGFRSRYVDMIRRSAEAQALNKHFPLLAGWGWDSSLGEVLKMMTSVVDGLAGRDAQAKPDTVFEALMDPPNVTPSVPRDQIIAEGMFIFFAGTETTAVALTYATYYVLRDPSVYKRLLEELDAVVLDGDGQMNLAMLEHLPYFSGVIKESLRLSTIVPGKLPRVTPKEGGYIRSTGHYIPPGTVISVSHYMVLHDATIFTRPKEFLPERWLGDGKRLDKFLVCFSKGARACVGINLAYAELYLVLATLFGRFAMELFEADERTMEWVDHGVVHSRGVLKVRVTPRKLKRSSRSHGQ